MSNMLVIGLVNQELKLLIYLEKYHFLTKNHKFRTCLSCQVQSKLLLKLKVLLMRWSIKILMETPNKINFGALKNY
jgi:hypothetical protein